MTERRYYFQIPSANVIDCVLAVSLTDAKQQPDQRTVVCSQSCRTTCCVPLWVGL